ncbi:hypothetical protein [Mesorhizobium sp. GbtcB19]|uniref:hypothetical protein n=1 Tax=Mesorhizobium sp. GbtcB19 TaxID=2824764 RepID=UPI001C308AAC|nr:hypothetical protein [Mesorhizobium sp. GbtcB19]
MLVDQPRRKRAKLIRSFLIPFVLKGAIGPSLLAIFFCSPAFLIPQPIGDLAHHRCAISIVAITEADKSVKTLPWVTQRT